MGDLVCASLAIVIASRRVQIRRETITIMYTLGNGYNRLVVFLLVIMGCFLSITFLQQQKIVFGLICVMIAKLVSKHTDNNAYERIKQLPMKFQYHACLCSSQL